MTDHNTDYLDAHLISRKEAGTKKKIIALVDNSLYMVIPSIFCFDAPGRYSGTTEI